MAAPCARWQLVRGPVRKSGRGRPFNTIVRRHKGALVTGPATTAPRFDVPAGACDCHTHIHDPERFPYFEGRSYTPEPASPDQMAALHEALHIERVVIVTPSIYGTDNRATLLGISARGKNGRGVAVIDDETSDEHLDALHDEGIRGIRLNFVSGGVVEISVVRQRLARAIARIADRPWHVQVLAVLSQVPAVSDLVERSRIPVVFDHFGLAQAALGVAQFGFRELMAMVRSGSAYVKISGGYRISRALPDFPDAAPLARALVEANVDRVIWGTDWPHPDHAPPLERKPTEVTPNHNIDDGHLMNLLPTWVPDPTARRKILVDNPARLYDF